MAKNSKKTTGAEKPSRDKAAKFRELANKRANAVLKGLRLVGQLGNRASYEYSDAQVIKIFAAIADGVTAARDRFKAGAVAEAASFQLD